MVLPYVTIFYLYASRYLACTLCLHFAYIFHPIWTLQLVVFVSMTTVRVVPLACKLNQTVSSQKQSASGHNLRSNFRFKHVQSAEGLSIISHVFHVSRHVFHPFFLGGHLKMRSLRPRHTIESVSSSQPSASVAWQMAKYRPRHGRESAMENKAMTSSMFMTHPCS